MTLYVSFYIFTKVGNLCLKMPKCYLKLQIKTIILFSYSFNNYSLLITVMFAHDVIRQDNIITCYLCGFVNK